MPSEVCNEWIVGAALARTPSQLREAAPREPPEGDTVPCRMAGTAAHPASTLLLLKTVGPYFANVTSLQVFRLKVNSLWGLEPLGP